MQFIFTVFQLVTLFWTLSCVKIWAKNGFFADQGFTLRSFIELVVSFQPHWVSSQWNYHIEALLIIYCNISKVEKWKFIIFKLVLYIWIADVLLYLPIYFGWCICAWSESQTLSWGFCIPFSVHVTDKILDLRSHLLNSMCLLLKNARCCFFLTPFIRWVQFLIQIYSYIDFCHEFINRKIPTIDITVLCRHVCLLLIPMTVTFIFWK